MDGCREFRALLFRVTEGEAGPDEAFRVARHLPDCTACRILFAREGRLARMLDGLGDAIPVDEAFLEDVMRALPRTAPAPPRRAAPRARRGLKLAGLFATMAVGAGTTIYLARLLGAARFVPSLPRPRVDDLAGLTDGAADAFRLAVAVLDRAGTELAPVLPAIHFGARIAVVAAVPALVAVAAVSTLLVLVARSRPGA